jgi:hypothetical protein
VEAAKKEIKECICKTRKKYGIPSCIADGILSAIIAEIKEETKIELLDDVNAVIGEKEEELTKAKLEAKKVLKMEPENEFSKGKTIKQDENEE